LGISHLKSKASGFTLVEVLISLSIFAILLSTLLWGFRQGLMTWEKASKNKQVIQRLLSRHNWLEKMFNEAVIADYSLENWVYVPYFKGNTQQFSWITASPLLDVSGHIRPVALKWEKTTQGYSLYYREGDWHSDAGRGLKWSQTWVELIQTAKQGQFSYEAPAFPLPEELKLHDLSTAEKQRYRSQPEWLKKYDTGDIWRMPLRIKLSFVDLKKQPHEWLFSLPNRSNVLNLEFYRDD